MSTSSDGTIDDQHHEMLVIDRHLPPHRSVFTQTRLFQLVMQVLATTTPPASDDYNLSTFASVAENITTTVIIPTDDVNSSLYEFGTSVGVWAIIVFGTLLAVVTTVGNLMVMVSFKIDKQLQTISNYFLLSLAVADITIGFISIPLMTYYTAMNTWSMGYTMCQLWLCVDYLMSNASVLNLLLISFDRFFSVTRPLTYRPRRTTRKALTMIASTYIISLILWPPWIISWPYIEGKFTLEPGTCVVQFLQTNPYVTVGTAVAAFYLPVTIVIVLYSRVYWETKKRQKQFGKLQAFQQLSKTKKMSGVNLQKQPSIASRNNSMIGASMRRRRHVRLMLRLIGRRRNSDTDHTTTSAACTSSSNGDTVGALPAAKSWLLRRCFSNTSSAQRRTAAAAERAASAVITAYDSDSYCSGELIETPAASGTGAAAVTSFEASSSICIDGASSSTTQRISSLRSHGSKRPMVPDSPTTAMMVTTVGGQRRPYRRSTDRPITYTVLIELDGAHSTQPNRPSVRLSSCELDSVGDNPASSPILQLPTQRIRSLSDAHETLPDIHKLITGNNNRRPSPVVAPPSRATSTKTVADREAAAIRVSKVEKERKKNERKQESKAAKTLSAILFAFIITWTPYNVIVCWEAFYPNTISNTLFTISYYLCYLNSTINPVCYALCNARFRHTYRRILKCRWQPEQHRPIMLTNNIASAAGFIRR